MPRHRKVDPLKVFANKNGTKNLEHPEIDTNAFTEVVDVYKAKFIGRDSDHTLLFANLRNDPHNF